MAGMQSVHTLLKLAQLRWTGHVTRMPDERLPKKKRSHGGQKKRYKDTLKASLKEFNIPTESWEQTAQDRTKWRGLIRRGAGETFFFFFFFVPLVVAFCVGNTMWLYTL